MMRELEQDYLKKHLNNQMDFMTTVESKESGKNDSGKRRH